MSNDIMCDEMITHMVTVTRKINTDALKFSMAITNPKTRVRTYLQLAAGGGKFREGDLAYLLDVHPAVVRCVARQCGYQYGFLGEVDGYWYPTARTFRRGGK